MSPSDFTFAKFDGVVFDPMDWFVRQAGRLLIFFCPTNAWG
jgi:hypothetical protein